MAYRSSVLAMAYMLLERGWTALETIKYYHARGSDVYSCLTDMSKAFDTTLHSLMFSKMLDAGLSPIFV